MKILAAIGRVAVDAFVWGFYGAFTMSVIGGITGVLHGVAFNLLAFFSGEIDLEEALFFCCLGGLAGLAIGAYAGAVALSLAGIYRSVQAQLRFAKLKTGDEFMINAAGATQAGFVCSFAGASTGAVLGIVIGFTYRPLGGRIIDAFALGYALGAMIGFALGACVGAFVPERVRRLREQFANLWSERRRWLRGS